MVGCPVPLTPEGRLHGLGLSSTKVAARLLATRLVQRGEWRNTDVPRRLGTLQRVSRLLSMLPSTDAKRDRAERIFRARVDRQVDAPKAIAEYHAAEQRIRDRTKELRQLRLAREAQEKSH